MTTNSDDYQWMYKNRQAEWFFPPYETVYYDDYLINDFTLSELKMLKRKMRQSGRN